MATILLVIIYIAFISLGLPDSILGSAWPNVHQDLNVPVSYAGFATMIVTGGTIVSSFFSVQLIRKFKTGLVTVISVVLTAVGLLGISIAPGFLWICILGIPLGLGAGAIDSALNNFVALHYEAKHMNWLHCFWGIGATAGPLVMSIFLARENGWKMGYITIGIIQTILVLCLVAALPLWKRFEAAAATEEHKADIKITALIKMPGAKPAFVGFFCYCAVELTTGLWGSTYLVEYKGISAELAARWVSVYYLGITLGRFLAGFLAMKINNRMMIRLGQIICIGGAAALMIPFSDSFQLLGLVLIGLGLAPIYPAMLHETPNRFGKEISQGIMGMQMAVAYIGNTFMPPLFGMIAKFTGFWLLPYFLLAIAVVMFLSSERVSMAVKHLSQDAAI